MEGLPISAVIAAHAQGVYFRRHGLVHQCIFPLVKTSNCFFQIPDWSNQALGWKAADDSVHCNSDVKQIDPTKIKMITGQLEDHALEINLTECCAKDCNGNDIYDVEDYRTQELINTLLINRELEAKNLVINASWTSGADPAAESSEGKRYEITPTNFVDDNYKLANFFDALQDGNGLTGRRNFAVIPQGLLKKMLRRKDFIGGGCSMPAQATIDALKMELGVETICLPDAYHNTANFGAALSLGHIWPQDTILLGANTLLPKTDETVRTFGISANSKTDLAGAEASGASWEVNKYLDAKKGKGKGNEMLKIGHDETPMIVDLNAGTLVVVTT